MALRRLSARLARSAPPSRPAAAAEAQMDLDLSPPKAEPVLPPEPAKPVVPAKLAEPAQTLVIANREPAPIVSVTLPVLSERPAAPIPRPPITGSSPETAVSVSRITAALRLLLEDRFSDLWVVGEVSNSRPASSGHYYFTLKDPGATLQAVLFRSDAARISCPLPLRDGQSILARGRLTVYDSRGQHQLQITDLRLHGDGLLQQRFLELKQRLQSEGLFALDRKRKLPVFPEQIGIVTSLQGAVLHDLCTVLARRAPGMRLLIRGVRVQGAEAAQEIAQAIRAFSDETDPSRKIDLLIVARGGGSLEDLWPFNEELVARALAACSVPTVSAVGHETDFSISDFVADLRAPTPSAAAEMITRDWADWRLNLKGLADNLIRSTQRRMAHFRRDWSRLADSTPFRQPERALQRVSQRLDETEARLRRAFEARLSRHKAKLPLLALRLKANHPAQAMQRLRHRLDLLKSRLQAIDPARVIRQQRTKIAHLAARLQALGPQSTLDRGYALLLDAQGKPMRKAEAGQVGQPAKVLLSEGSYQVDITAALPEDRLGAA